MFQELHFRVHTQEAENTPQSPQNKTKQNPGRGFMLNRQKSEVTQVSNNKKQPKCDLATQWNIIHS